MWIPARLLISKGKYSAAAQRERLLCGRVEQTLSPSRLLFQFLSSGCVTPGSPFAASADLIAARSSSTEGKAIRCVDDSRVGPRSNILLDKFIVHPFNDGFFCFMVCSSVSCGKRLFVMPCSYLSTRVTAQRQMQMVGRCYHWRRKLTNSYCKSKLPHASIFTS